MTGRSAPEPGLESEPDPRITLAVLRQLALLDEHGSLSSVARRLGLSQPTISANMSRLERALGFPIIARGPRGAVLTREGKIIVDAAQPVLRAARQFAGAVAVLSTSEASQLRIGASLTIAEQLVPRWLANRDIVKFADPVHNVEVSVGNSREVMEWVTARQIDVGFVEGSRVAPGLAHATVGRDELVVVVAPTHHWAEQRRAIEPDELVGGSLVVRELGSGTLEVLVDALGVSGTTIPDGVPSFGSTSAILTAVRHAGAVAVVSRLTVEMDLAEGRLVRVPVPSLMLERRLTAVWNSADVQRRAAVELVAGLVRRHAEQ